MIKKSAFRGRLKLFTALTVAGSLGAAAIAMAQTTTPEPVVIPGDGASPNLDAYQIQQVKITYKKLLLRQKNIPNAVTNLGPKQIAAENPTMGSIQSLLKQAPSVTSYSQGVGQQTATLAIRGVRNDELAETLDGVPINNLLVGSGDYLDAGSMSSPVTLNEIDGVTIYPGLAPPADQGFGTTGGTIAYTTKQPTDDRYEELEGVMALSIRRMWVSSSIPARCMTTSTRQKRSCYTIRAKPPAMSTTRRRNITISCSIS
jgi:iron complex outermembrane receptor protein